jgi:hypothetical protein
MTKLEYAFIIAKDKERAAKGYLTCRERKMLQFMIDNPTLFIKEEKTDVQKEKDIILVAETKKEEINNGIVTTAELTKEEPKTETPKVEEPIQNTVCFKCGKKLYPPKGTVQLYCNKVCRKVYRRTRHAR